MSDYLLEVEKMGDDARNIKVSAFAYIKHRGAQLYTFNLTQSHLQIDCSSILLRDRMTVGFRAVIHTSIAIPPGFPAPLDPISVPVAEWNLGLEDGVISISDRREPAASYASDLINFEAIVSEQSSTRTEPARVTFQARISPTKNTSGNFSLSVSKGPVEAQVSTSGTVSSNWARSDRAMLSFVDHRPKLVAPVPPPAAPIVLPLSILRKEVGYYKEGEKALSLEPRARLNEWLDRLLDNPDCKELLQAIREGRGKIIELTGFASNTAGQDVNDPLSFHRAMLVQEAIMQRLGVGRGIENSFIIAGAGVRRGHHLSAPRGPIKEQKYVLLHINETEARKAITAMRASQK